MCIRDRSMAVKKSGISSRDIDAMVVPADACAQDCSICLDGFGRGVECVAFQCGHYFHKECIKRWTCENDECPNCRAPIKPKAPPRRLQACHSTVASSPIC
eukprot:TRINITY_DN17993_c0_g1_i1.p1 TRINITY_DN17993_c0_g1~~TRINITY_DN17993_c0_g1_i1.p1  ORF type:complete len:101 (+),score=10.64 TRINITY_DN17993_c0_g1_i1:86-388(+)